MRGQRRELLSFSEWLDVVWAHMLSKAGAMSNPYEFREVMKAAVGYSDRTVEQVLAAQKAKGPKGSKGKGGAKAASTAKPLSSEVEKMKALFAKGNPDPGPVSG